MKIFFKKYITISLAIVLGSIIPRSILSAANYNQAERISGEPYNYTGNSGNRVTGRGATGRFTSIQQLGMEVIRFIETLIVPLIMSLALLAFLWGVLQYIRKGGEPAEREQGRQFMFWGIISLAIMVSVWGLVRILTNTIGVPIGIPSLNSIQ